MTTPYIIIVHDHVMVEATRINRPSRISPSQWLRFWEYAVWANDHAELTKEEITKQHATP